MSRTTTTTGSASQSSKPAGTQPSASTQAGVPLEKIATLAYEKWLKGGCKHGNDQKDWIEAEAELKAQMTKAGTPRR